ncbi:hypothetical protein ACS0TY_013979 [Phlomoides rotata]
MSYYKVDRINDSMHEFYVHFHGPSDDSSYGFVLPNAFGSNPPPPRTWWWLTTENLIESLWLTIAAGCQGSMLLHMVGVVAAYWKKAPVLGTPIFGDYKYGWQAHKKLGHRMDSGSYLQWGDGTSKVKQDTIAIGLLDSGSVSDIQFCPHLHFKEIVLPNISVALEHGNINDIDVEKAFREGTARQNAHNIFVCLVLKLLEECVHVAASKSLL